MRVWISDCIIAVRELCRGDAMAVSFRVYILRFYASGSGVKFLEVKLQRGPPYRSCHYREELLPVLGIKRFRVQHPELGI